MLVTRRILSKFWVMWTYLGNYGGPWVREASSAEVAGKMVVDEFSQDFAERGVVYVFDSEPTIVRMSKVAQ